MAKRRAHNEGTIYQREDGLWVAQISMPNGRRKSKYGKTQRAVREWLEEQKGALKDGVWVESEKITLGTFLDRYLSDVAAHTLRPKSFDSYAYLVRNHIKPELGDIKLSLLRPDHVQNLYSQKLNQGLSRRSVQYIHAVLHKALSQAEKWGLVVKNVADVVDAPRPGPRTRFQHLV